MIRSHQHQKWDKDPDITYKVCKILKVEYVRFPTNNLLTKLQNNEQFNLPMNKNIALHVYFILFRPYYFFSNNHIVEARLIFKGSFSKKRKSGRNGSLVKRSRSRLTLWSQMGSTFKCVSTSPSIYPSLIKK